MNSRPLHVRAVFQRPVRAVTGLLLAIAVAGCALGPDYRTPPSKLAADFENAAGDHAQEPPREFWRRFDDPILNQLVEDALKALPDAISFRNPSASEDASSSKRLPDLCTQAA